jgi:GntR family transcriptional regulator/MocR family aminotransferase
MGATISLERRLALLAWASETGALVIEDDYDSEFRFEGRPQLALQGLRNGRNVVFAGRFNKILSPALRLGYVVLSPELVDPFLALRYGTDLRCTSLVQFYVTLSRKAISRGTSTECAMCTPAGWPRCWTPHSNTWEAS